MGDEGEVGGADGFEQEFGAFSAGNVEGVRVVEEGAAFGVELAVDAEELGGEWDGGHGP